MVKQSRSLKNDVIMRRILFLFSTASDVPFYSFKDYSRYSFELILLPSVSNKRRVKSLTTHMKEGKNFASSSGSVPSSVPISLVPALLILLFLTWIVLERLTIKERFYKACSSMVPIELYTKYELNSKARRNIRVS